MKRYLVTLGMIFALSACDSGSSTTADASQDVEELTKCDEYAAHPDDPGRWAEGVTEDELIPGPAVKFCTEAVNEYPQSPRFQFQLGRALLKAEQYDQAIEALTEAANMDYGPAYAYLADIYRFGVLGKPDTETAAAYYDIAIASGFAPAQEAKQSMLGEGNEQQDIPLVGKGLVAPRQKAEATIAETEEEVSYYEQPEKPLAHAKSFDPSGFASGEILSAVYEGDFSTLRSLNQYGLIRYLSLINNYFAQDFNMIDESCSAFADPALTRQFINKSLSSTGLYDSNQMPTQDGVGKMINMYAQMLKNPNMMTNVATDLSVIDASAKKDGVRLAQQYGCKSDVVHRIYGNMASYLRDSEPVSASGWVGLQISCRNYATINGGQAATANKVCGCFIDKFKESGVSKDEANWLAENYDQGANFNKVVKGHDGLNKEVTACLL